MLERGLEQFAGKRVLLLQGPVGSFFTRFSKALRNTGAEVLKINFNGGDWLFFPRGATNYRGTMAEWPAWFRGFVISRQIDVVFLFGDCRPIHRAAHTIATEFGLEIGVFEEGYIRPNYITLERYGVNGHSRLPREAASYRQPLPAVPDEVELGRTYWPMVWCGFRYFLAGALGKLFFPHYRHHRPLSLMEAWPWARSVWRKQWYRIVESGITSSLTQQYSGRFYLVSLQVFNDAQVTEHSDFSSVEQFIIHVLQSFAQHAPRETILVFKHHPMDRGYKDYGTLIRRESNAAGCGGRVWYIHDQHLPILLVAARGVVVINSTVGLSALSHGTPTKVCSRAIYDIPDLTYQGSLDEFWGVDDSAPDMTIYHNFHQHVVTRTQLNGSFYKPLAGSNTVAGLIWHGTCEGLRISVEKPCAMH